MGSGYMNGCIGGYMYSHERPRVRLIVCVSRSMRVRVSVSVVVGVAASNCDSVTTLLVAAVITSLGCFSLSRDLVLAVESCVFLVAAAG